MIKDCIRLQTKRNRQTFFPDFLQLLSNEPPTLTVVAALKSCRTLKEIELGNIIHMNTVEFGLESTLHIGNTLIDMYGKCGNITSAIDVFNRMERHTVVSWNSLMLGYVENGLYHRALELFNEVQPNFQSFVTAFKACTFIVSNEQSSKGTVLHKALELHARAAESRLDTDNFVGCTLLDLYGKCCRMDLAQQVFERINDRSVAAWNNLIQGYLENKEPETALDVFQQLHTPDPWSFVCAVKSCSSLALREAGNTIDGKVVKVVSLEKGKAVHRQAADNGCLDMFVVSSLVDMYAKCGSVYEAKRLFDSMPRRDVVPWNALVLGYAENEEGEKAWDLFMEMLEGSSCSPNYATFVAVLKACGELAAKEGGTVKVETLKKAMVVHSRIGVTVSEVLFLASALIDLYVKCGSIFDARRVFDCMSSHDVVSCTSLLLGYVEEDGELAWEFYSHMQHVDDRTMVAALNACSSLAGCGLKLRSLEKGMSVHRQSVELGYATDVFVRSALIDMYGKCGSLLDARRAFDSMFSWDKVCLCTMLLAYVENEEELAMEFLTYLVKELEFEMDVSVIVAALKTCSNAAALGVGKALIADACRDGIESNTVVSTAMLDVYGKCGNAIEARGVFDRLSKPNVVTWNALLTAYSRHGESRKVLESVHEMETEGASPNGVTFVCVLSTCSCAGLVETGKRYYKKMVSEYGLRPSVDHTVCVVDMLGRANRLNEAVEMVNKVVPAEKLAWMTILGASHKWKNIAVGRLAFESVLQLDNRDDAAYVLMGNIYASLGMWENKVQVEEMRVKMR